MYDFFIVMVIAFSLHLGFISEGCGLQLVSWSVENQYSNLYSML